MGRRKRCASLHSLSASEVARSPQHFDTWCKFNNCKQVVCSDLPDGLFKDAKEVFDISGKLPLSWVDKPSNTCYTSTRASTGVHDFLKKAYEQQSELFSADVDDDAERSFYNELDVVKDSCLRLQRYRRSGNRWSESDFASKVYGPIRNRAIKASEYQTHCAISLPQPIRRTKTTPEAERILEPSSIIPDAVVFTNSESLRHLSTSKESLWNMLQDACRGEAAVSLQTTPRKIQTQAFEFASTICEDKKAGGSASSDIYAPGEGAYRQNCMACAASLRMMASLGVNALVFGILWEDGKVKMHVNWWEDGPKDGDMLIHSAPFTERDVNQFRSERAALASMSTQRRQASSDRRDRSDLPYSPKNAANISPSTTTATHGPPVRESSSNLFHVWKLDKESDILSVFLLLRNIDNYTEGRFKQIIMSDLEKFVQAVVEKDGKVYRPWKRKFEDDDSQDMHPSKKKRATNAHGSHGAPKKKRRIRIRL